MGIFNFIYFSAMNDDFDFNYEDLSDEEKEELERERKEKEEAVNNHPLYKKADEIYRIVSAICEAFPEDSISGHFKDLLYESSMILGPKLAGAMHSESWQLSMQNASIIRYHASYLLTNTYSLEEHEDIDPEYIKLLRKEMIHFRELFKKWISEINRLEDDEMEDEWGLFIRK